MMTQARTDRVWIVLAHEGRARILELDEPGAEPVELEELTDAAAHARNADLRRDAYGRRAHGGTGTAGNKTESAGEEKLDHAAELFARRIADHLENAKREHRFERLHVAAAPRFLGRLRKQISPEVSASFVTQLDKDLLHLDRRSAARRLVRPD